MVNRFLYMGKWWCRALILHLNNVSFRHKTLNFVRAREMYPWAGGRF